MRHCEAMIDETIYPMLWCNDQEPLDYEFYRINLWDKKHSPDIIKYKVFPPVKNLNWRKNIFEKNLLLHSEQRSWNLDQYIQDDELIPVYYWCHAFIARDWFRFAKHERFQKESNKLFLIYNRAWSGTREYRLKFADLLIEHQLYNFCKTTCNSVDPESQVHYETHKFKNIQWRPKNKLEDFFVSTTADASSSADFVTNDYETTDIEIVLETLFDDDRLQLTEKILRPIACGQPFILASTHHSLKYLQRYGFKTFGDLWDESYDNIENPEQRLCLIIAVMKEIASWDDATKQQKLQQAQTIADYNRTWFFSEDFWNLICGELQTNLTLAFQELASCNNFQPWINHWKNLLQNPEMVNLLDTGQLPFQKSDVEQTIHVAMQLIDDCKKI
jgi:hypothetical protein